LVFDTTDVVDLSTAEGAFATLLDARDKPRAAAADLVRALKTKTRNSGNQSHEIEIVQADAWLAICALSKNLDTDYETSPEVWSRAISRTEEWRNLLARSPPTLNTAVISHPVHAGGFPFEAKSNRWRYKPLTGRDHP